MPQAVLTLRTDGHLKVFTKCTSLDMARKVVAGSSQNQIIQTQTLWTEGMSALHINYTLFLR